MKKILNFCFIIVSYSFNFCTIMGGHYIKLGDLFVHKISIELCDLGWQIYEPLHWQDKKTMGDQFVRSADSCAANIAEGYGRYHYLDKIKFYYNARGSLLESKHWIYLLNKRNKTTKIQFDSFLTLSNQVNFELNKLINTTYSNKHKDK